MNDNDLPHAIMPDGRIMQLVEISREDIRKDEQGYDCDCEHCYAYSVCRDIGASEFTKNIGIDCTDYDTEHCITVWRAVDYE